MNIQVMPTWVRVSMPIFGFNFVAFTFVMFSCWFPTGFSATFSTIAFLFSLPIFIRQIHVVQLNSFELVGLGLFGWLTLSIIWSSAPVLESLGYLSEYRIYFMVPVFVAALALDEKIQHWAFAAAMLGAFIALVTSYGLGFDWWIIDGAHLSLANRIFHGFIMSLFLLACLLMTRETRGLVRVLAAFGATLVVYNILNIEMGRTGYLQVVFVILAFTVLTWNRRKAVLAVVAIMILLGMFYLLFERLHDRVNQTVSNGVKMILHDEYRSSEGYRLEFYRGAIHIGIEHPLLGVGVGGVSKTLQSKVESGEIRVSTDNVHSEFMNMLIAGGVPALFLFAGFTLSIAYVGFAVRSRSHWVGDALIGLSVILFISALFNSTIKDYGEKHVLMITLSILGARLLAVKKIVTTS